VAAHARRRGARRVWVAPQAVDAAFWTPGDAGVGAADAPARVVFVGRDAPGKGLDVLLEAWRRAALPPARAELVLAGPDRPRDAGAAREGIRALGPQDPGAVRNLLRSAAVLVVPSVPTPTFREPWGLVCNEAMHLGLPVIASSAVGAAAGGLVRHERNGLVVPAGDADALRDAIARLHADPGLRIRLGRAGPRGRGTAHLRRLGRGLRVGARRGHRHSQRSLLASCPPCPAACPPSSPRPSPWPSSGSRPGRRLPEALIRDCQDGTISGRYSAKDFTRALRDIPTDVDEYTDCRDVIRRAQLGAAGGGGSTGGGGSAGGGDAGAAGGGAGSPGGGGEGRAPTAARVLASASPQEAPPCARPSRRAAAPPRSRWAGSASTRRRSPGARRHLVLPARPRPRRPHPARRDGAGRLGPFVSARVLGRRPAI
jgi:uncharacterized membrane protein YgcG